MSHTPTSSEDPETDEPVSFELAFEAVPERLDKVLARLMPQHSRSQLQGWIHGGHVWVGGRPARTRTMARPGDLIQVWPQRAPEERAFEPQDVSFALVADSPDWLVIDKPAGLVVHPGAGNWGGTLLNGLLFRYPELAHVVRAGIVHRLDKDTSGLLVVARNEAAQAHLVRQLQARSVWRLYGALVHGWLHGGGCIRADIGRDPRVPVRMAVDHPIAPKQALTHYRALRHGCLHDHRVSQLECRLETGRTHQIRVHLSSMRHPLLGDTLYGGQAVTGAVRQMLHARELGFIDPSSGREQHFTSPWPADFNHLSNAIQWQDDGHDSAR